jgi:cytoskeletal protein CcmA (bactofilin family)
MIVINGKVYNGNSVTINNNQVIVDGVVQGDDLSTAKEINIDANGFRGHLSVDGNVKVLGNIDGQIKAKGSVSANNVYGDVSAGGSVNCDDIKGNASAGGSINCDDIGGNAMAGGSIRRG